MAADVNAAHANDAGGDASSNTSGGEAGLSRPRCWHLRDCSEVGQHNAADALDADSASGSAAATHSPGDTETVMTPPVVVRAGMERLADDVATGQSYLGRQSGTLGDSPTGANAAEGEADALPPLPASSDNCWKRIRHSVSQASTSSRTGPSRSAAPRQRVAASQDHAPAGDDGGGEG